MAINLKEYEIDENNEDKWVGELSDDLNKNYLNECMAALVMNDSLNNLVPLLDTKIVSPEAAIVLQSIMDSNQIKINVLEYGSYKLDIPKNMNTLYKNILTAMNYLIGHICYLDSLKGGNMLNIKMLYEGESNITPIKFKYTDDMIDINHPIFKNANTTPTINKFKNEYPYLFDKNGGDNDGI